MTRALVPRPITQNITNPQVFLFPEVAIRCEVNCDDYCTVFVAIRLRVQKQKNMVGFVAVAVVVVVASNSVVAVAHRRVMVWRR